MKSWQRGVLMTFTGLVFISGIITFFRINVIYNRFVEIFFWLGALVTVVLSFLLKKRNINI